MISYSLHSRITRLALCVAGLSTFALCLTPILFGLSYVGFDMMRAEWGVLCEIREAWRTHGSFLLSTYRDNGLPLLADPESGLFYPPQWLAMLLPFKFGSSFPVIFHLSVAACGAAWLARTFRLSLVSSISAGISFALTGTVLNLTRHSNYICGAAWLPFVWAATRRVLQTRDPSRTFIILVLGLAACLLGADPQSFMMAGLIFLAEYLSQSRRLISTKLPRLGLLLSAGVTAVLLSLIQWLPTLAEARLAARAAGFSASAALDWAFDPIGWLATIWPSVIRPSQTGDFSLWEFLTNGSAGRFASAGLSPPWNQSPYIGPLFLGLTLIGLALRKNRAASAVFLFALALSLGSHLPVLPILLKTFPILSKFRYPSKYLLVVSLAGTLLAFSTLDSAIRSASKRKLVLVSLYLFLGFQLSALLTIGFHRIGINAVTNTLLDTPKSIADPILLGLVQSTAPLLGAVLLLIFLPRLRKWAPLLIVLDLVVAAPLALDFGSNPAELPSPLTQIHKSTTDPGVFCFHPSLVARTDPSGETPAEGDAIFMKRLGLPHLNACNRVVSANSYGSLDTEIALFLYEGLAHNRISAARALGCTHFVSDRPIRDRTGTQPRTEQKLENLSGVSAFEVPDSVPMAFVSKNPILSSKKNEILIRLMRNQSSADVIRIIEDLRGDLGSLPSGEGVTGLAVDRRVPHRASILLSGSGGGVVGLRTRFAVGWTASQARLSLPIVRVAGGFPGAIVADIQAGPVVFEYHWPYATSAILLGLLGVLLLGVVPYKIHHRAKHESHKPL